MKSVVALEEFQKIIQQDQANISFCESELNWIENRKADWSSDRIRVGVIGVTSSGKSTLINAILGTDILSSAIAPSSGQLVCCSYGEKPEIIIHFEDGTEQKLSGQKFSRDILQQYSDERYNPKNEKGVLSIELTSPLFDFGKDVLLVDSPGLDAFGLESHERLTLESLVPTIDACIYVTTMKTNSDRKTLEILNTVAKYHCPIIIVQNMLDSVRPSPSGDKTSEQVVADHQKRVKRIVDNSNIADKDSVQIIQISAELAKRWRAAQTAGIQPPISEQSYRKSNYEMFVGSVTGILEVQRPRIERQRLLSIHSCASSLNESIQNKISKPAVPVASSFPLQDLKEKTKNRRISVQKEYQSILQLYETAAKRIRIAIGVDREENAPVAQDRSSSIWKGIFASVSNRQSIEENLKATNAAVSEFESSLADLISKHNDFVTEAAKCINIPSRDLLCSSALHSFRAVSVEQKTVTKTRRVKKEGFGGAAARGLGGLLKFITGGRHGGNMGYEEEEYEVNETDTEKTKEKICARLADAYTRYTNSMADWEEKSFNRSMGIIEHEIETAEKSYLSRKAVAVEMAALSKLEVALISFIEKINRSLPNAEFRKHPETDGHVFTTKEIDVPAYISSVLNLSRAVLQQQHRAIAQSFVAKIGCNNCTPIIISWDDGSCEEFIWQTGIIDAKVMRSPVSNAGIPQEKNRCIFVLVNAIQYGAALKQISALKLNSILTKQDYVVWVVQDFQELLTGDRAVEGLTQMSELSGVTKIPCKSSIYIMHENPIYNLTFLKHQFDRSLRLTPHKLIDDLQSSYEVYLTPVVSDTLGDIVRKVNFR